jgi:multiple sugar transport system substrate-binding protein
MDELTTVVVNVETSGVSDTLERFVPQIRYELNIDLKVETVPFADKHRLQLDDLSSDAPQYDIYIFWPMYLPDYAPNLYKLKDIAPSGAEQVQQDLQIDDVHPAYHWVLKYKGDVYTTQIDGDVKLLHYRYDLANDPQEKAAFKEKYGYELDMNDLTWDKYYDIAEFFTRPEEDFYGTAEVTTFLAAFYFMDHFSGHVFDYDDMTPFPDKEIALQALQNGADIFNNVTPPEAKSYVIEDLFDQLWVEERVFMVPFWPDGWRQANDPNLSNAVGRIAVAEMPGFERDGQIIFRPDMSGGRVAAIGQASEVPEAAYKVLVFFSDKDRTQYLVNDTISWLDPWRISHMRPALYSQLCKDNKELCQIYVDVIARSTVNGYPGLQMTGAGQYQAVIENWVGRAWRGEVTAEAAYGAMVEEMEAITNDLGREKQLVEWRRYVDEVLKPRELYP